MFLPLPKRHTPSGKKHSGVFVFLCVFSRKSSSMGVWQDNWSLTSICVPCIDRKLLHPSNYCIDPGICYYIVAGKGTTCLNALIKPPHTCCGLSNQPGKFYGAISCNHDYVSGAPISGTRNRDLKHNDLQKSQGTPGNCVHTSITMQEQSLEVKTTQAGWKEWHLFVEVLQTLLLEEGVKAGHHPGWNSWSSLMDFCLLSLKTFL